MTKLYLAHPFNSRYKIKKWFYKLKKISKHEIINPFYPQRVYESFTKKDVAGDDYYKNLDHKRIVEEDIKLMDECDAIIGVIDGALSYGTILEIGYAYCCKKPIYLIVTNKHHNHPWIKYYGDKVFNTYVSFERWLKNL